MTSSQSPKVIEQMIILVQISMKVPTSQHLVSFRCTALSNAHMLRLCPSINIPNLVAVLKLTSKIYAQRLTAPGY